MAERGLRPFGSDDGEADPSLERLDDLRTLPAYRDVTRSVVELNAARAALLKAAAGADGEAAGRAAADYHRTLEQVRSALATLKSYVDPAEFQTCLRDLFMPHAEAELGGAAIQESCLGILPRVEILPRVKTLSEENLP